MCIYNKIWKIKILIFFQKNKYNGDLLIIVIILFQLLMKFISNQQNF